MPRRKTVGGAAPVTSRPAKTMRPEVGGSAPVMRLKRVVLPAPFGPMIERTSPRETERLTRFTAARPPKRRVSSRVSRRMAPVSPSSPARIWSGRTGP